MPTKILVNTGSVVTWSSSGATKVLTATSVANGAGRLGDRHDWGSGVVDRWYEWQVRFKVASAPTVGNVLRFYLATGRDGTYSAGNLGTTDAAVSAEDLLRNTAFVDAIEIDEASSAKVFVKRGLLFLRARYVSPILWNATGVALSATGTDIEVAMWPSSDEVQ